MKMLNPAVARVLRRLHYPLDVILTCVRWYGLCRGKGRRESEIDMQSTAYIARL